jgi:CTD small phosphatase-like protein 2
LVGGKNILPQKHFLPSSEFVVRMESSTVTYASNLERIYSDYYISDMIVSSQPIEVNSIHGLTNLTEYKTEEPNLFVDENYVILPVLETSNGADNSLSEETLANSDDSSLYLAIHQLRSCNQDPDVGSECFDTQLFIKNIPDTDVISQAEKAKSITLVLDLDETLVHSTLEYCDDADFTFPVDFNMKIHTVYVKQRPFLHTFLQKVVEMFEIVVFTASQSIYAEKLLDILDPNRNLISRRAYRESCIFSDGSYTKDLTILGVDLAKVAIIDNSPQVYRWQVNNGIPIKSWFDDKSDTALLSLLPFLESLVEAEDVRPIIAKRFSKTEY